MPKMVRIGPNPGFKPKAGDAGAPLAFAAIKAKGVIEVDYVTAMENVVNSGGMYAVIPEASQGASQSPGIRLPEDMTADELKLTALQLGVDLSKKQMKKSELVKAVRLAMDRVSVLEDGEEDGDVDGAA